MSDAGLILSSDKTRVLSFVQTPGVISVSIPDSVTTLPKALFSGCDKIVTVKLPKHVTILPDSIFENCTSLEKVVMPMDVTSLGERAFYGCTSLQSIPFRAGLTELAQSVFENCTSLQSLVIPDTVGVIESRAVANCSSLRALVLPASLEDLAKDAFDGCSSLRHIRISEENPYYKVNPENGCLYRKQDDGIELIVLSPIDFAKEKITLNALDDNFEPFFFDDDEEFDDNSDVISIMNAQTILDDGENSFDSDINDVSRRAQEIVQEDLLPSDDSFEPIADDELSLLSAEGEILSQNLPISHELQEIGDLQLEQFHSLPQQRIANSAGRYECIELNVTNGSLEKSLHVFAESLANVNGEPRFSKALVQCSKRMARLRGYTHLHFYYNLPLENEEFANLLKHFVADNSVIFACKAGNTSSLSPSAKRFIEVAELSLEKDAVENANKTALNDSIAFPKMILQDDYSE